MAKRKNEPKRPKSTKLTRASNTTAEQAKTMPEAGNPADQIEPRMAAFAEQLGRTVGTMQVTAEEWMNRETVLTQLAAVRDGAARLLNQLTNLAPLKKSQSEKPVAARGRSAYITTHAWTWWWSGSAGPRWPRWQPPSWPPAWTCIQVTGSRRA